MRTYCGLFLATAVFALVVPGCLKDSQQPPKPRHVNIWASDYELAVDSARQLYSLNHTTVIVRIYWKTNGVEYTQLFPCDHTK